MWKARALEEEVKEDLQRRKRLEEQCRAEAERDRIEAARLAALQKAREEEKARLAAEAKEEDEESEKSNQVKQVEPERDEFDGMLRVRQHLSPTKYTAPNPTEFEVVLDKDELLYRISDGFLFGDGIELDEKTQAQMRLHQTGGKPVPAANATGMSFKKN